MGTTDQIGLAADDAASPSFVNGPLRSLPAPVRGGGPRWQAVAVAWATAFIPSIILSAAAAKLFPGLTGPEFKAAGPVLLFLLVIFSPLIETLIMAGFIELLRRFLAPTATVIGSALGWAIAHSLAAPSWGLVIWWPFLVFSTLYVAWRGRGKAKAVGMVFLAHACQNLPSALLLLQR